MVLPRPIDFERYAIHELIRRKTMLGEIHTRPAMAGFLAAAPGRERHSPRTDILSGLNRTVMAERDEQVLHFDEADFSTRILLQLAASGREFQYECGLRGATGTDLKYLKRAFEGTRPS